MTRGEIVRFLILRSIGNFLVLFAIFGVLATFGPVLYYEISFRIKEIRGINYHIAQASEAQAPMSPGSGFGSILTGPREQILIPKDTEFDILIPKIGANSRIFPNVSPSNPNEFLPILQKGVAHARGTVFPGMPGNIYLFAHSTDNFWDVGRYNAVFYLIKDLSPGDEIVIFFEGQRHNYTVTGSKTVDPSDVSYIVDSKTGKEQLILQTCWPPGTTWKRLLVFARPK